MRLTFASLWLGVEIRLGREDTGDTPDERGPGALSADLTISTSDVVTVNDWIIAYCHHCAVHACDPCGSADRPGADSTR